MVNIFRIWINRYLADEEAVLLLVLLVASVILVMTMGDILAPFIAASIIAFMLEGMVARLRRWGVNHIAAVSITTLVFIVLLVVTIVIVLPVLWQQLSRLITEVPGMFSAWRKVLLLLPERYPTLITEYQVDELVRMSTSRLGDVGQRVLQFSVAQLPVLITVLVYLVLVPILVFFLLKDGEKIGRWLAAFLPTNRPAMTRIWLEMNLQIANYVRGKVIEILIVGGVSYLAFKILGLNYALLLGIAVGFSVLVPYIGAAVVTVPVAMIAYFQWGWTSEFMTVMVVYGIIQMLDGNVLVPILFSEAVNLHPIAIILAVLVFGGIWGFWGVFFAIPLATFAKAIINAWPTHQRLHAEVAVSETEVTTAMTDSERA